LVQGGGRQESLVREVEGEMIKAPRKKRDWKLRGGKMILIIYNPKEKDRKFKNENSEKASR